MKFSTSTLWSYFSENFTIICLLLFFFKQNIVTYHPGPAFRPWSCNRVTLAPCPAKAGTGFPRAEFFFGTWLQNHIMDQQIMDYKSKYGYYGLRMIND
jgi:hypothetical protein